MKIIYSFLSFPAMKYNASASPNINIHVSVRDCQSAFPLLMKSVVFSLVGPLNLLSAEKRNKE